MPLFKHLAAISKLESLPLSYHPPAKDKERMRRETDEDEKEEDIEEEAEATQSIAPGRLSGRRENGVLPRVALLNTGTDSGIAFIVSYNSG
ncbi:hypothetical protein Trydic_g6141 [Trypoxylus dichotomus]